MEHRDDNGDWLAIGFATVLFAALSITAAIISDGFLEADACMHYLYARFAIDQPHYLIDIWGRPVCTGWYAIPAALGGRLGVRLMSLAIALGIAIVTQRIAKLQGYRWPALAFIFVLAQPLVFLHSFSEMTELPFALLIAVAFLAYREKRWWEFALVVGTTPLSRPEGFGFLLLAVAALVLHRAWKWTPLLAVPLVLWSWGGWEFFGRPPGQPWWRWLFVNWPYAAESLYMPGYLAHFAVMLPAVTSCFVFPAVIVGMSRCLAPVRSNRAFFADHATRCDALIAILPMLILIGHSVLYWRGKMASNGELRYMLVVAPFWALLAAKGWAWIFERLNFSRPLRWAGIAGLCPLLLNWLYPVLPLQLQADWDEARLLADWYDTGSVKSRYPFLLNSHPAIWYYMDVSPTNGNKAFIWSRDTVANAPDGVMLIWDPIYGRYNADQRRSVQLVDIRAAGWIEVDLESTSWGEWRIFLSPRDVTGQPSALDGARVSPDF